MNSHKLLVPPRVLAAASVGGGLEMYDFIVYVFFSSVIAQLFFPQESRFISMLATFGIFAIGYFVRPLGGLIFGYLGDKYGRKKCLLFSILTMGIATVAVGCLPTYAQIGIWAPLLLTLLRLIQGIAVGADFPGAMTFVAEHATPESRGFNCAIVFLGINAGLIIASGVAALLSAILLPAQLSAWGWRIAFWMGAVLIVLGLYWRLGLEESKHFELARANQRLLKNPLTSLLKMPELFSVIVGLMFVWLHAVIIIQLFTYTPTFLNTVTHTMSLSDALILNTVSTAIFTLFIPVMGYISDRIGRKKLISIASVLFIVSSYPLYFLLQQQNLHSIYLALFIFDILGSAIVGCVPAALTELFATEQRYSGVGVAYNISYAIIGGLTPLILTILGKFFPDHAMLSLNIILASIVCLGGALLFKDKTRLPL